MTEQLEFFEIPSPCIRVCQTDERGVCMGCFRNRQERFDWLTYSNTEKREVLRLTKQRYIRFIRAKKNINNQPNSLPDIDPSQFSLFDK
ncbi:DUF1289 domain-containing protein [Thorsellia anophelis]|uniref:DUF1289 domain-containing protein n=1 Tax=Thorsellia anophelis DSM 18579 TaxID=1123402 RepID=A0A1I0A0D6_9GAMM|nr:DUF1289 domain-containing protein [Thorsellia anophelis]SES86639.1 hypothetical protein SAMN02583745_00757 [Thorsellia anophelis DSM 18579]